MHFWHRYFKNICRLGEWLPPCFPSQAYLGLYWTPYVAGMVLNSLFILSGWILTSSRLSLTPSPKSDTLNHISLSPSGLSSPPLPGGTFLIWNHGLSSFKKKNQTKDSGGGISPEKHVAELSRFRRPSPSVQKLNPREMKLWISYLCSPFSLRDKGKINSWVSIVRC